MKAQNQTKLSKPLKIIFITGLSLLTILFVTPPLFLIIYIFLFRPFQISGDSMMPAFNKSEYVISTIVQHDNHTLKRGDVIVFISGKDSEKDFIKRIVGLPGETISIKFEHIYINGQKLDESAYLAPETLTFGGAFLKESQTITVPDNTYFVLGDNREKSSDSREWGFVPRKNIISVVSFCYWNCK